MNDEQERHLAAWTERRANESRAMLSTAGDAPSAGSTISTDGKCIVCSGDLCVMEHQPHLDRDWCWCSFCGNSMPATLRTQQETKR